MTAFHRAIDLDLKYRWFANKPVLFPYPALRNAGPILSANHTWECLETLESITGAPDEEWTVIAAVQWEDQPLFVTKIRVTWRASNVDGTAEGEYKHVPVASGTELRMTKKERQELTAVELALASEWYGRHVFDFAVRHVGCVVGDGECWTLARQALVEAGKKAIQEGHDPPMVSVGRVHGQCIFEWTAGSRVDIIALLDKAKPAKGDIMEMEGVRFRKGRMLLGMLKEMTTVNMGKHTAIVDSVQGFGSNIKVVEQNVNAEGRVVRGEYELSQMLAGKIKIYRPIGQSMHSPKDVDLGALCRYY